MASIFPSFSGPPLMVLALLSASSPARAVGVDDFHQSQAPITGAGTSVQGGAMLGNERDLQVAVSAGVVTVGASLGTLPVTGDASANGTATVTWDGDDNAAGSLANNGLAGENLTAEGDNAFLLGIKRLAGTPTIGIIVHSGAASSSITVPGLTASELPQLVRVPYSVFAGTANFASAGAIQLQVTSLANAEVEFDFLRTGSSTAPALETLLTDVVLVDNDANGKASPGDTLRYVVTIKNNDATDKTGVLFEADIPANTSSLANLTATPIARDEAPSGASAPNDAFHTALNTPLTASNGDPDEDLLNNDFLGEPAAAITKFGGGTLGGTVDSNDAGAAASSGGHSLTVNADGSFSYTPANNFTGLFTFEYRLGNSAGSDTATVTLAVGIRPNAVTDSYNVTGNTMIDTTLGGLAALTANDTGDQITVTANGAAAKGTVSRTGGNFIYTPNAGASGADSFTYTLNNGFGDVTGTVNLNIANEVWYIDSSSVAGTEDGRSGTPFKTLASFNAANTGASAAVPGDNDSIFIRQGTYVNNVSSGAALTLRSGQKIVGDGWSGTFNAALGFDLAAGSAKGAGVAVPAFSDTDPVIRNPSGTAGNGIALNSGNTLRGLTVGNTPSGFGYSGGAVGSLVVAECSKTGTGGAISITTSGAFASNVNFDTFESTSSTGANLNLVGVTGTLGVGLAGRGFEDSPATAPAINISGGSVSLTYPGDITKDNSAALLTVAGGHAGTLTFHTGTLNASAGTGLQFDNADGIYNFNGTTTLAGGDAGIDILAGSFGTFSFGSGTSINSPTGVGFNMFDSDGSVSYSGTISKSSSGHAISIDDHDGNNNVIFSGSISSTGTSGGILVQNCGNGTVAFSGGTKTLNTGGNPAVTLTSNTGATNDFTGGNLDIDTTSGTGFTATGGGTVTVTGSGNSIISTSATALNVASTTIGSGGLTFNEISAGNNTAAADPANGIILNNTGSVGFLSVTGNGALSSGSASETAGLLTRNGTGGTIQNTTGDAVSLVNAFNVTLRQMNITSPAWDGVHSSGGGTVVLSAIAITTPGAANPASNGSTGNPPGFGGGNGWIAVNITGVNAFNANSRVFNWQASQANGVVVTQTATDFTSFTIDNAFFSTSATGADGFLFDTEAGATSGTITVEDSDFTLIDQDAVQINNDGSGAIRAIVQNNNFHDADATSGDGNNTLFMALSGSGDLNFTIQGNTFRNLARLATLAGVLQINAAGGSGTSAQGAQLNGTIQNNTLENPGFVSQRRGIMVAAEASAGNHGGHVVLIANNSVQNFNGIGIYASLVSVAGYDLLNNHFTIRDNQVGNISPVGIGGGDSGSAIEFETNVDADNTGAQISANVLIQANTARASNTSGIGDTLEIANRSGNNLGTGNSSTLNLTILGNNLTQQNAGGDVFQISNSIMTTTTVNVDLNSDNVAGNRNTFTGGDADGVLLRNDAGTFRIENLSGGAEAFVEARNNGNVTVTGTIANTGAVPVPTNPSF